MSGIDRRTFLKGAAAGTAGLWLATHAGVRWVSASHGWSPYQADPEAFPFGVASGDPLPDRVVIWTQVAAPGSVDVGWQVARDPGFTRVVAAGAQATDGSRDHTVKVDVGSGGSEGPPLDPATTYFYRFTVGAGEGRETSRVGRTRTAPPADPARPTPHLAFALASCQHFEAGFYAAWRHIAKRGDLDFVLQVGDYIYEGDRTSDPITPDRVHHPEHEIIDLGQYRRRYRNYRSDEDLKAAHAAHPFIVAMDDHEVANNSWREGAQAHQEGEGSYLDRRADAFQAYREWMPIRLPDQADHGADHQMRIYRSFAFGDLVDLFVLDSRQYRSQQLQGLAPFPFPATDPGLDDPDRTYLGEAQKGDFTGWLDESSKTRKARWRLVGNQAMLAPLTYGPMPDELADALAEVTGTPRDGYPVNPDQWDGYQAERKEILERIRADGIENVVVCTGDIHSSWVNEVLVDEGKYGVEPPVAAEFVGPSISSDNLNEATNSPPRTTSLAGESSARAGNPHIRYVELDSNGYVVVRVGPERVRGDWYHLSDVRDPDATEELATAWEVASGDMRPRWVGGELVAT